MRGIGDALWDTHMRYRGSRDPTQAEWTPIVQTPLARPKSLRAAYLEPEIVMQVRESCG